jgi:hypothetical protein
VASGGRDPGEAQDVLRRTERWFLGRGLPHLIEGYRASEDVFTRSVGVLSFIALVEVVNAVRLEWRWWQNTLALLGGATLLVGLYLAVNLLRGRTAWQRPNTVGPVELGLFVVLPALVVLVFGQPGAAVLTAVVNLALLGLVYVVTSYGLIPMTRWALSRTVESVATVIGLVGRALPLLFAVTILAFVNTEAWQVASALPGPLFAVTVVMFVVVGLLFLLTRLPGEVRRLDEEVADGGIAKECIGTPMEQVAAGWADGGSPLVPSVTRRDLSRRQRANVYLVVLFAQAVQALLVTAAVFAFFTAFGAVAIQPVVVEAWLGDIPVDPVLSFGLFGHPIEVTSALLHVSGFVATIAGFIFTVSMVTDSTYRDEFLDDVVGQVRQALGVRAAYLALRETTAT